MRIQIVTHCYAEQLPQYASFLAVHLESVLNCPDFVDVIICCTDSDDRVFNVLAQYTDRFQSRLRVCFLPLPMLGRRAIGRNINALDTQADLVWFADVDYFWRPECFLSLRQWWESSPLPKPVLAYPGTIWTQSNEHVGDALLETLGDGGEIDTSDFEPKHYGKAIGGIQIISGDYCRKFGYCNHTRKVSPLQPGATLFHTTEDSLVRKMCAKQGKIVEIDLPGVYRLRHTRNAYQYPQGRPV